VQCKRGKRAQPLKYTVIYYDTLTWEEERTQEALKESAAWLPEMLALNGSQAKLYHTYSQKSRPQPNSDIKQVLNTVYSGSVEKNGATDTKLI